MKTCKVLLLAVFFAVYNSGYTQNILDFFQMLPDSSVIGLSKKERLKIVTLSSSQQKQNGIMKDNSDPELLYSFDVLDIKNGYLKLIGAMEGHLEMCYWNLKNGKKLIAIYQEGCGPECNIERFDFYNFDGNIFTVIPKKSVIPDIYDDFFKTDKTFAINEMGKRDISATLLFELPQKGKDIKAKWGNTESRETYQEFAKGNRMILKWNDGKFEKSDIFWSE